MHAIKERHAKTIQRRSIHCNNIPNIQRKNRLVYRLSPARKAKHDLGRWWRWVAFHSCPTPPIPSTETIRISCPLLQYMTTLLNTSRLTINWQQYTYPIKTGHTGHARLFRLASLWSQTCRKQFPPSLMADYGHWDDKRLGDYFVRMCAGLQQFRQELAGNVADQDRK